MFHLKKFKFEFFLFKQFSQKTSYTLQNFKIKKIIFYLMFWAQEKSPPSILDNCVYITLILYILYDTVQWSAAFQIWTVKTWSVL